MHVSYVKEEIEIRAESLKNEIDEIKESLINKVHKIKIEFEQFVKHLSFFSSFFVCFFLKQNQKS